MSSTFLASVPRLVWLSILLAACSNSPSQPTAIVVTTAAPDIAGRWRGLFETTSCVGATADCPSRTTAEFMLTLVPSGPGLEGLLVLLDKERTTVNVSGSGSKDGSYRFTATGFQEPTPDTYPVRTVVSSIEIRTDSAVGLAGSMTYTNQTFRPVTRTVAFRSALRQPAAEYPGHFDGTWLGYYRTLACSGDCKVGGGGYSNPTGGVLSMTLSDAGGQVVGSVLSNQVTGTATVSDLTAGGPALTTEQCPTCWDCEGVCQTAVRAVSARVDKLGRLSGTFEYSWKGWTGNEHFRQVMLVEIVSVTRRW